MMKLLSLPDLPTTPLQVGDIIRDKFGILQGEFLVVRSGVLEDGGPIYLIARTDRQPILIENGEPIFYVRTRFAETWAKKRQVLQRVA